MKKYALNLQATFDYKEELEEILADVLSYCNNLDEHPNCGCPKYDFDVLKQNNKNVYHFMSKLKLQVLLGQTKAFDDCGEDYRKILDNILFYMSKKDVNYDQVIRLLQELKQNL